MPPITKDQITLAQTIADKICFYIQTQALSSDFVRSDVTRRDRMFREFGESGFAMSMRMDGPERIGDVGEFLRRYDELLGEVPETFEDHFYRMHYAFSALVLYKVHVVQPTLGKDSKMRSVYAKRTGESQKKFMKEHYPHLFPAPPPAPAPADPQAAAIPSPSPSPSPSLPSQSPSLTPPGRTSTTIREHISPDAATKLLRDHFQLMQLQFIFSPDTEDEIRWRVCEVNLKADGKVRYMVQYTNTGTDTGTGTGTDTDTDTDTGTGFSNGMFGRWEDEDEVGGLVGGSVVECVV